MDTSEREIIYIVGGAISCSFSGMVVLTGLVFPSIMLSRTHPFSNIIFFISICDMLASLSNCFGFPNDSTTLCSVQSALLLFFFPASWMWTSALIYQLRCMLLFKRLYVSMFALHCICWSVAALTLTLPLSQTDYGQDDQLSGRSVCTLRAGNRQDLKLEWIMGLLYVILLLNVLFMTWGLVTIAMHIAQKHGNADVREVALFRATRLYPFGLVACWSWAFVMTLYLAIHDSVPSDWLQFSEMAATQYGTVLALVFFYNSKIVRMRWKELFFPYRKQQSASINSIDARVNFVDNLDPEGITFSTNGSICESPSFSDFRHMLSAGRPSLSTRTQNDNGNSRNDNHDDDGDNYVPSTSFVLRDWLRHHTMTYGNNDQHSNNNNHNANITNNESSIEIGAAGAGTCRSGEGNNARRPYISEDGVVMSPIAAIGADIHTSSLGNDNSVDISNYNNSSASSSIGSSNMGNTGGSTSSYGMNVTTRSDSRSATNSMETI